MALGAGPHLVPRLVLREGLLPAFAGLLVGLAGTYYVGRVMKALLYQVNAMDPAAISAVATVLLLPALCACCIPEPRHASRPHGRPPRGIDFRIPDLLAWGFVQGSGFWLKKYLFPLR
jgi:hypothetical protein